MGMQNIVIGGRVYREILPAGRPKKDINESRLKQLLQEGLTREDIAQALGVSPRTLYRYMKERKMK